MSFILACSLVILLSSLSLILNGCTIPIAIEDKDKDKDGPARNGRRDFSCHKCAAG